MEKSSQSFLISLTCVSICVIVSCLFSPLPTLAQSQNGSGSSNVTANVVLVNSCSDVHGLYEMNYKNPGNYVVRVGTPNGELSALQCTVKVGGDLKLPPGAQTITVILNAVNEPQSSLFEVAAGSITLSNGARGRFTLLCQAIQRVEIFFSNISSVCTDVRVFDTMPGVEMALHFAPFQPEAVSPQTPWVTNNCRHQLTVCKLRSSALVTGAVDVAIGSHVPRPQMTDASMYPSSSTSAPQAWYSYGFFPLNPLDMPLVDRSGNYPYYPGSGDSYNSNDGWPEWAGPVNSPYVVPSSDSSWGDIIVQNDPCYIAAYSSSSTASISSTSLLPANPLDILQGTLLLASSAPTVLNASVVSALNAEILAGSGSVANWQFVERTRLRVLVASHVETSQGFSAHGVTLDAIYFPATAATSVVRSAPSGWLCSIAAVYGLPLVSCLGLDINRTNPNAPTSHALIYSDYVDVAVRTRGGNDVFSAHNLTLAPHARLSVDLSSGNDFVELSKSNSSVQIYTGEDDDTIVFTNDLNAFITVDVGTAAEGLGDNYHCDTITANSNIKQSHITWSYAQGWTAALPMGSTANGVILVRGLSWCDTFIVHPTSG